MRSRVSFVFTGILVIALIAVGGFAAFSTQQTDPDAVGSAVEAPTDPFIPQTASGRILGAVVAAALTPEPTFEALAPGEPDSIDDSSPPATEPEPAPPVAAEPPPTTTAAAPDGQTPTANVTPPDTSAPDIAITSPKDGSTVGERVIEFRGTTEPDAIVTSGSYTAEVDEDGTWSIRLVLREGRNRAYFTATDDAGNSQTESVSVVYDPPATTTSSTSTSTSTTTSTIPPPDTGGPRNVEEWRSLAEQYFASELVDEALAVIKCESKGDPAAYNSRSGASGLFQFIPNTWNWASNNAGWAGASPFDPEANIASAAWLVQWSLDHNNSAWAHWSCKP